MTDLGASTPAPVFATHHGIEYPGEMVRVQSWQADLGRPLTANAYFRIVFVESPSPVSPDALQDKRIAVYVPGQRTATLDRAERELRVARAMGGGSPGSGPLDPLERETQEIENWAVGAWAESLKTGNLITANVADADLTEIFRDGYWSTWAERIGLLLLRWAYPDSPMRADLLRIPIRPDADAPILFDAFMAGGSDTANFAIDSFVPGLGLTSAASSRALDLKANDVDRRLTAMVADGRSPDTIGHALAHEQGLTYPLASLHLLLWIRHGHHTARLRPDHGLLQRDRQPYTRDVLTSADVPSLQWPHHLWRNIESLTLSTGDGQPQPLQER